MRTGRLKYKRWLILGIGLVAVLSGLAARLAYVQRVNVGELHYAYEVARKLGYTDAAQVNFRDRPCAVVAFGLRCIVISYITTESFSEFSATASQQGFIDLFQGDPYEVFDLDRITTNGTSARRAIEAIPDPSGWRWTRRDPQNRDLEVRILDLAKDTKHMYAVDGTPIRGNLVTVIVRTRRRYL